MDSTWEEELYNHSLDPQEWTNAAGLEDYKDEQEKLKQQLISLF